MIGGVGQKVQTVVELAEELYERVNELRARIESVSDTVEDTADRVERLETELAEQRAVVEAIAEDHGVDVDAVVASVEGDESGGVEEGESADREEGDPGRTEGRTGADDEDVREE